MVAILKKEERIKINKVLEDSGVIFVDIENAYIDEEVTVGRGTVIYPNVILEGKVFIGEGSRIGLNSRIRDSEIGNNVYIEESVIEDSIIKDGVSIGPFAHIRPKTMLSERVKIGAFVETKNSNIGNGSKASHLTYIGDADLGENINLGCGVVFVNYDGKNKFRSTVEDEAFIGCNVNIVSPVKIGKRAYIAAGSTVTNDIDDEALFVARSRGTVYEGWNNKNKEVDNK